jgi:hypothetical protein
MQLHFHPINPFPVHFILLSIETLGGGRQDRFLSSGGDKMSGLEKKKKRKKISAMQKDPRQVAPLKHEQSSNSSSLLLGVVLPAKLCVNSVAFIAIKKRFCTCAGGQEH